MRVGLLLLVLLLLLSAPPAFAQSTINVDATCSFAEAIGNANDDAQTNSDCEAGSGADTIVLTRKVELTAHAPDITGTLTIDGRGHTIDGMTKYRPINIVTTGADVTMRDITLTRGSTATFSQGQKEGGAIRLTLPSSPDTQNGSLTLTRVRLINNAGAANGGALSCSHANLTISDSVIADNSAAGQAGAVNAGERCAVTIRRSAFHGNSGSSQGGAILTHNGAQRVLIVNSTFYNNRAARGGAIFIAGGIYDDDAIKLHHLTITGNNSSAGGSHSGAGVHQQDFNVKVHLLNSILWGNTGGQQCRTVAPGNLTFTNNIVEAHADNNCGTASNADPRLPASPTGRIPYFPLPADSPAIGAAGDCSALTTEDQRGFFRPYPVGGFCDVGAYEWHAPPPRESGGGGSGSDGGGGGATGATGMATTCETLPANVMVANRGAGTRCQQVSGAGIGVEELVKGGAREAVDVWNAVSSGTKVCFAATSGDIQFLDAAGAPRSPEALPVFSEGGMLCATIDRPGTAVLMPGPAAPAPEEQAEPEVALATADAGQGLSNCMVRTTHILNLRQGPDGAILGLVPFDVTLTAFQRNDGWYEVDYLGARGWISAGYVTPQGNCG